MGATCGGLQTLYNDGIDGIFGYWAYAFYISKIYEFIDTFIVIARGRRPIFLQTFHHCGAVLGVWAGMVTHCTGGYIFIVLNSFIHTIMYFYYAVSSINIRLPGKKIITQAQMFQFFIGNSVIIYQMYFYGDCMEWEDKVVIWYHIIYTSILLLLFKAFYSKAYKNKIISKDKLFPFVSDLKYTSARAALLSQCCLF